MRGIRKVQFRFQPFSLTKALQGPFKGPLRPFGPSLLISQISPSELGGPRAQRDAVEQGRPRGSVGVHQSQGRRLLNEMPFTSLTLTPAIYVKGPMAFRKLGQLCKDSSTL